MMTDEASDLREQAVLRIKKKRDFAAHVLAYVLVNGFLIVLWYATSHGFFWPIFPLFGWGIGLIFHGWDVYRGEPTEAEIDREMSRLQRRQG
jgi:hypothetical protein